MDILLLRHALIKRQPADEQKKENFTDGVQSFLFGSGVIVVLMILAFIFFQVLILKISLDCTANTESLWLRGFHIFKRQILGVFYLVYHLIATVILGIHKCGEKK